jgi:hypothetical protein
VYLATFVASVRNESKRPPGVPPLAPASDVIPPRIMSLFPIPVNVNVPVEIFKPFVAELISEIVAPVNVEVVYIMEVSVDPPLTLNDPAVNDPERLPVVPVRLPIVAVLMVAVLADNVPIVTVPVDAVILEPNVIAPS